MITQGITIHPTRTVQLFLRRNFSNTNSATLSKEEFFQVKRKKRSNNIILSVVAKNGIIESILRIEAIWTRSVENCNLRHRYEVLRIGDEAQYVLQCLIVNCVFNGIFTTATDDELHKKEVSLNYSTFMENPE
ncbi:hypothetical protein T01_133 [Trichinella spiralis]|uniref:Uncharacterized protein n=1 Tax=Trichinella spiralis TaxID=6334 RepID=A0A0V1AMT5_TRISP|nr:hypothetical protein T01_3676 [Trichinella spiralis]KRY26126.1 hypothetical protein T01_133 [Trichinella spiralis]